ncbi:hypothetical protein KIPB_012611, partial [Kipferlia bialata]
ALFAPNVAPLLVGGTSVTARNIVCGNSFFEAEEGAACVMTNDDGTEDASNMPLMYNGITATRWSMSPPEESSIGFPSMPNSLCYGCTNKDWMDDFDFPRKVTDTGKVFSLDDWDMLWNNEASDEDIAALNAMAEQVGLTRVVMMPTLGVQGSGDSENMLYTFTRSNLMLTSSAYNMLYTEKSFELGPLSDLAPNRLTVVTSSSCADACSALVLGVQ